MKRFFALAALVLIIGAPLAQTADANPDRGQSTTTSPAGDILD